MKRVLQAAVRTSRQGAGVRAVKKSSDDFRGTEIQLLVEVAGGAVIHHVAHLVRLPGVDEAHVAVEGKLQDEALALDGIVGGDELILTGLVVPLQQLLALLHGGAHAGGGQDAADAGAAGPGLFAEGALGHEGDVDLAGHDLLHGLGVVADVGAGDVLDAVVMDQAADALALDAGVAPDAIGQYENIIKQLDSISEDKLSEETEQASRLRQNILYQDFLNRGYKEERAKQLVKRAVDGGTDIDDAKDALESNKQFYRDEYQKLIDQGKQEVEAERQRVRKEAAEFKKAVLEKEKIFGDIQVDKVTRQKAYDAMTRIVGKNADGDNVTAVQKFADENPVEFRSILGIMWAMTDGFKELGNVIKQDINKKVRSNLKEVENRIKGSAPRGGSPRFIGGDNEPSGSRQGWMLDV